MGKIRIVNLAIFFVLTGILVSGGCTSGKKKVQVHGRPNFLILMSDNHSWNHVGCYGDAVVKTPHMDQLAKQGVRFTNAFCSSPSCTPARASMLTGQDIWRLEEGANLWGILPAKFQVYTDILEEAGYLVGFQGKGWGPGNFEAGGRARNPAGDPYETFEAFYAKRKKGQPFSFWFSSRNPHRPYDNNSDKAEINLSAIQVPSYLPDNEIVKGDISDYYSEIEEFDKEVGSFIQFLEEKGELDNTLIVVCSDNGWQMPRGLANLYTSGTKIPFIISMPARIKAARVVDDFVSLNDLAPTFLELADIPIPKEMTARSLVPILASEEGGRIDPERDFVVTARERHAFVRQGGAGYGGRAIITKDFLYIRNYEHEQWPAGDPPLYGDVDAHMLHYPSPTKVYMLKHRESVDMKELFNLAFKKRPAEELYDLHNDPYQMKNVAYEDTYQEIKKILTTKLHTYLRNTQDPRVVGGEMRWIKGEYFAEKDKHPRPSPSLQKELNLKEEYSYVD
ncbi:sulfatase family protein [Catalinimonas niigatensis]|uniref:sulfatase family protein n=1 Tax=Catalinimonas niigatensis TaxID=1397264 RepID=UPI002665E60D|nr:sulfatase [Catalinimonas niigatensis]WPP51806.1 sulfatase [Catalinimonas niigatensis]